MSFACVNYNKIQFLINQSEINQIVYYDPSKNFIKNDIVTIYKDNKIGSIILFNFEVYMSQILNGFDSSEKNILLINISNQSLQNKVQEFIQEKELTTKYVGFIFNHSIESLELSVEELKLFSKNVRKHLFINGIAGIRWRDSDIQYWLDMEQIVFGCLEKIMNVEL
jgi:hypothetical protein